MASAAYLKRAENGTYYVHWTENRIGKRVSTRTKDLADAQTFFAQWMLMERSAPAPGAIVTVADCWAVYDREHVQKEVMGRKKAEYHWSLLEPAFGALTVSGLSQNAIDAYRRKREGHDKVKPSTVRTELAYLIAAIKFCTVRPHKLVEPAEAEAVLAGLTLPPAGAPRERWLRTDEIKALLKAAEQMRIATGFLRLSRGERFLWLALETAARKEAILELTWDRVDFETGTIEFNVPGRRITKKRRATVPISSALRPVLERAYRERLTDGLVLDHGAEVWATVQSIAMRAGLAPMQKVASGTKPKATGVSPHVLRHTAATHMARRGVPLYVIAGVLGNTLAMIERVYAKHCRHTLRTAVDCISTNTQWRADEFAPTSPEPAGPAFR